mmetsp:Transcript_28570/g.60299  ORF Transcript_28570/g.60299 Transcript_28570/m.60299 type:complete len:174 (-) Transcript_28570:101-622(-)
MPSDVSSLSTASGESSTNHDASSPSSQNKDKAIRRSSRAKSRSPKKSQDIAKKPDARTRKHKRSKRKKGHDDDDDDRADLSRIITSIRRPRQEWKAKIRTTAPTLHRACPRTKEKQEELRACGKITGFMKMPRCVCRLHCLLCRTSRLLRMPLRMTFCTGESCDFRLSLLSLR